MTNKRKCKYLTFWWPVKDNADTLFKFQHICPFICLSVFRELLFWLSDDTHKKMQIFYLNIFIYWFIYIYLHGRMDHYILGSNIFFICLLLLIVMITCIITLGIDIMSSKTTCPRNDFFFWNFQEGSIFNYL